MRCLIAKHLVVCDSIRLALSQGRDRQAQEPVSIVTSIARLFAKGFDCLIEIQDHLSAPGTAAHRRHYLSCFYYYCCSATTTTTIIVVVVVQRYLCSNCYSNIKFRNIVGWNFGLQGFVRRSTRSIRLQGLVHIVAQIINEFRYCTGGRHLDLDLDLYYCATASEIGNGYRNSTCCKCVVTHVTHVDRQVSSGQVRS
jgi:hypothetical protein